MEESSSFQDLKAHESLDLVQIAGCQAQVYFQVEEAETQIRPNVGSVPLGSPV
jgi:sulfur transfer protein SufE